MEEEILSFKSPSVRTGGASLNIIDQFLSKTGCCSGLGKCPFVGWSCRVISFALAHVSLNLVRNQQARPNPASLTK